MKKIEGIIISDERHNELLEKERKADSNVISLFLPVVIANTEYSHRMYYEKTSLQVSELYLEGEFENKEAAVELIKQKLTRMVAIVEQEKKEADWQFKKRVKEEQALLDFKTEVAGLNQSLSHYNSLKNKWWFKLFTKITK